MTDQKDTTFVFSPFRIDPARRLLTSDGQAIALKPKEFDTLLMLVQENGRVVDKDELMALVWPDTYVSDGSLAKNISVLRKALGQNVIETHRGRGYRITLPVVSVPATMAPASPDRQPALATGLQPQENAALQQTSKLWTLQILLASLVTIALLISVAAHRSVPTKAAKAHVSAVKSILIEKSGGLDPIDEGFGLARPMAVTHVMRNNDNTGFDRWNLVTDDQNFYYHTLSDAEKEFALQHDWRLTCVCALEKGSGEADVDLGPGIGPRFDMLFLQEGARYFVAPLKQISPQYQFEQKIEFPGVADVAHPHDYELRFDHVTQTASLWIDGQLRASGYRGHHQYQENYGLMFGASAYRDASQGSIVFREVRFEVN